MIVEHEGKTYKVVIKKPINRGDYYYDFMINKVKQCESLITFDPWSLKMELKEDNVSVEEKINWHIDILLKKVYYLNKLERLKIIK